MLERFKQKKATIFRNMKVATHLVDLVLAVTKIPAETFSTSAESPDMMSKWSANLSLLLELDIATPETLWYNIAFSPKLCSLIESGVSAVLSHFQARHRAGVKRTREGESASDNPPSSLDAAAIDALFVGVLHSDSSGWNVKTIGTVLPVLVRMAPTGLTAGHARRILARMQRVCTDRDFDKASPFDPRWIEALEEHARRQR